MADQLILKFPSKNAYLKEDFYVSSSNQEAYDFVNSWPKWIKRVVNIFGPSGSGKTHLASMLKNKSSNLVIKSKEVNEKIFFKYKTKEILVVENFENNIPENLLFSKALLMAPLRVSFSFLSVPVGFFSSTHAKIRHSVLCSRACSVFWAILIIFKTL